VHILARDTHASQTRLLSQGHPSDVSLRPRSPLLSHGYASILGVTSGGLCPWCDRGPQDYCTQQCGVNLSQQVGLHQAIPRLSPKGQARERTSCH
jgi:hypothetical protein